MYPELLGNSKRLYSKMTICWLILSTLMMPVQIHTAPEGIPIRHYKSTLSAGDSIVQILSYTIGGLQSNIRIKAIDIAKDGELIVVTNNGLLWFDGREITNSKQTDILRLSEFNNIAEDKEGNVWLWDFTPNRVPNIGDVGVYTPVKDRFLNQSEIVRDILGYTENTTIVAVFSPGRGEVLVNTSDGLLHLISGLNEIKTIEMSSPVRLMGADPVGKLLLGKKFYNRYQLVETDFEGKVLRESPNALSLTLSHCFYNGNYLNCLESLDNEIYLTTLVSEGSELKILNSRSVFQDMEILAGLPYFFSREGEDYFIYTLEGGGFKSNELLTTVTQEYLNNTLPGTIIESESGMWLGKSNVLIHLSTAPSLFNSILADAKPAPISFRKITYTNDSTIYAASYRGFHQLKLTQDRHLKIDEIDPLLRACAEFYIHTFISSPNISGLFYFLLDRLRIADFRTNECLVTSASGTGIREIWDVLHIEGPHLYIATNAGLFIYHEFEQSFHRLDVKTADGKTLNRAVNRMHFLKDRSELLLASESGLIIIETDPIDPLNISTTAHIMVGYNVNDALFINNDKLLVSTWNAGLFLISVPDFETIQNFNTDNFLSSNATHNLKRDSIGRVWFSANSGLYVMDPDRKIIREFNIIEGIHEKEFNHLAAAAPPNWNLPMIYGGIDGITYFFPHDIEVFKLVDIKDFLEFREVIKGKKPLKVEANLVRKAEMVVRVSGRSESVQISPKRNFLRSQIEIFYRPKGSSANWQMADRGRISCQDLNQGSNKLEILIKYPNNELLLSEKPIEIYKRRWLPSFGEILLLTLGLALGLWIIWKMFINRQQTKTFSTYDPHKPNIENLVEIEVLHAENELVLFKERFEEMERSPFKSLPADMADFRIQLNEGMDNVTNLSEFNIEDMAALVNVSLRSLNRKIKSAFQMTPNKYLTIKKMQRARVLLQNETDWSLNEIAYSLGYDKASYFSKKFKDYYGLSPIEYKDQYFKILHAQNLNKQGN